MKTQLAIFSFLMLLVGSVCFAQGQEAFNKGMEYYKQYRLDEAIQKFQEATRYNQRDVKSFYFLGMACNYKGRYEDAAKAFEMVAKINPNYDYTFYYEASKPLIALGRFSDAQWCLSNYMQRLPKGPNTTMNEHMAKNRVEYATKSPKIREQATTMDTPREVSAINSSYGDYMPQVSPTGTKLYFTSVRKGGFDYRSDTTQTAHWGEDLYVSTMTDGSWGVPELLPQPLNSLRDDFGSAFTGDGQTMVYVRCGDEKQGVGNCDLYITQLNGTEWSEPTNMGNVINSSDWDSQPTISSDGTRIIFTSARSGGYGGSDLYMSEKNHLGDWGIPQNLGSTVNTPLNEKSPYLAPDGKTLYYSTDGHPGYGNADIFYCVFENGKWSKPVNLGAPVNSSGDDTNFSISAEGIGYFASSRIDPGNYDIYQVELPDHLKPKPTVVIQGIVSNSETNEPLGAVVLIEDINSGELIAINKSNSVTGEYLIVLPAGRSYSVSTNSKGFFFYSQSFDIPSDANYEEISMDISLEPIKKGTKVVLNNIFFESGKATLKPISYVELNKAVTLLEENATMVIEIGGHTDNVGSDELNLKLSEQRAKAVVDYMVLAGVPAERLKYKGYGETTPIADNSTAEGKAKNRRTEFEIVEF
ncbi:OmpA family protein [Marinoscillum sp. MHG1-6]|uniref:OmpA family protein n=1 Tax=Marinoscillum sp. MHG1-6 TaxID=2959627 RepID=UPI0021574AC8|nr:OmpA family protein [Marinoscillum sp. MHG1-6]